MAYQKPRAPEKFIVLKNGQVHDYADDDNLSGFPGKHNRLDSEQAARYLSQNIADAYPQAIVAVYRLTSFFQPRESELVEVEKHDQPKSSH